MRPHINKKKCFKCDCYDDESSQSIAFNRNVKKSGSQYFFKCKFCDFATAYSSNLQVHKLKHVHNACWLQIALKKKFNGKIYLKIDCSVYKLAR